jgi:hypothetical protein
MDLVCGLGLAGCQITGEKHSCASLGGWHEDPPNAVAGRNQVSGMRGQPRPATA